MAKKAAQNSLRKHKDGIEVQQQTIEDDNLLPAADELAKLNSINPDIVQWILNRTEKEQDARIKFNEDRMRLAQSDFKHTHRFNYCALAMAFIIVLCFLALSFYLILNDSKVIGTIFAGGTIAIIVSYFLQASRNNRPKE